jgi:hypothetical protein
MEEKEIIKALDLRTKADLLIASKEELEKCKMKNSSISD